MQAQRRRRRSRQRKLPLNQSTPSSAGTAAPLESLAMFSDPKPCPVAKESKLSPPITTVQPTPEPAPAVEGAKTTNAAAVLLTRETKPASGAKSTKRAVKRLIRSRVARSALQKN